MLKSEDFPANVRNEIREGSERKYYANASDKERPATILGPKVNRHVSTPPFNSRNELIDMPETIEPFVPPV